MTYEIYLKGLISIRAVIRGVKAIFLTVLAVLLNNVKY
jgi:hypothetical protein